jgi:hypothetical protein
VGAGKLKKRKKKKRGENKIRGNCGIGSLETEIR